MCIRSFLIWQRPSSKTRLTAEKLPRGASGKFGMSMCGMYLEALQWPKKVFSHWISLSHLNKTEKRRKKTAFTEKHIRSRDNKVGNYKLLTRLKNTESEWEDLDHNNSKIIVNMCSEFATKRDETLWQLALYTAETSTPSPSLVNSIERVTRTVRVH